MSLHSLQVGLDWLGCSVDITLTDLMRQTQYWAVRDYLSPVGGSLLWSDVARSHLSCQRFCAKASSKSTEESPQASWSLLLRAFRELTMRHRAILEEFVAAGDFLAYKFPVWTWYGV